MTRRFTNRQETALKGLRTTLDKLGAKQFEIKQQFKDGKEAVAIMFTMVGSDKVLREYRFICDNYPDQQDNFRAAQYTLQHWWSIIYDYKVRIEGQKSSIETLLSAFRVLPSQQVLIKALPDPDKREPNEILGVAFDANRDEINRAFRELAQKHHPDHNGDSETFQRIMKAKDEMLSRFA